ALLNGCSIQYRYTSAEVLVLMHNAYVSLNPHPINPSFDDWNETRPDLCPAGGRATHRLTDDLLKGDDAVSIIAYPNPFSNSVNVEFVVNSASSHALVAIYNATGQRVAILFDAVAETGKAYK